MKILRVTYKLKLIELNMIRFIKRFMKLKITKNSRRKLRRLYQAASQVTETIL